jgi:predicted amidohydrolase
MGDARLRVGFYQFRPRFGDPAGNCARIVAKLARVRADLIVLPELPFSGYYFKDRREAKALAEEPRSSPIVSSLVALCRKRRFQIVTGFAERARDLVFNSALLIGPRGVRRTYRKLHLFNEEKKWFDPGDLELAVDRVGPARVGIMVCFDWIFPETARALAVRGADVIAHPANLVLGHCQQAMVTRSLENGVFSVTCNRFGEDRRPHGTLRFTGRSQIVGPRGVLITRAAAQREALVVESIDLREARDKAITPRNHLLRDRRPDHYA